MNDIEKMVRLLEFADAGFPRERRKAKNKVFLFAAAAAAALALLLTLLRPADRMPVDSFSSPELAYARAEEAFSRISGSIEKCMDRTGNVYQKITRGNE